MATYDVRCPACDQLHTLQESDLGQNLACGACGAPFKYDEPLKKAKAQAKQVEQTSRAIQKQAALEAKKAKAEAETLRKKLDAVEQGDATTKTDAEKEKTVSLVTVKFVGKPLWIAATIVVALALAVIPFVLNKNNKAGTESLPGQSPMESPSYAIQDSNEADDPKPPSESSSESTYQGIGWSLKQIEAGYGAEKGWYWTQKKRNETGLGIDWIAENTNVPGFYYQVGGLPENLEWFAAILQLPISSDTTNTEIKFSITIPVRMVANLTDEQNSDELYKWMGEVCSRFAENSYQSHKEFTVHNGKVIIMKLDLNENVLMTSIRVQAKLE
ncbi:MAG: hypothetical protein MI923_21530 [Phycisphaerales bacterium]|nr:hypothetical protein [Phycisphaerales bacterium]